MTEGNKSTENRTPDRIWVAPGEGRLDFLVSTQRQEKFTEYMRVLSRQEVEKLASDEGVNVQQLINSYRRTIEGQRREIRGLNEALRKKASDEAPSFSPNFDERNGIR